MDIHQSEKHGPFARLYFFTAILVIVLGAAFILRTTGFINKQNPEVSSSPIPTNIEESSITVKEEVKLLTNTSNTIEKQLIAGKQLNWLEAKPIYTTQITNFKSSYTTIANIINFAKNKNIATTEIEKNFDDLKSNISLTETAIETAQVESVQKYLDLSLTKLNTIISLVGNL